MTAHGVAGWALRVIALWTLALGLLGALAAITGLVVTGEAPPEARSVVLDRIQWILLVAGIGTVAGAAFTLHFLDDAYLAWLERREGAVRKVRIAAALAIALSLFPTLVPATSVSWDATRPDGGESWSLATGGSDAWPFVVPGVALSLVAVVAAFVVEHRAVPRGPAVAGRGDTRFSIVRDLGRGGFGVTRLARDRVLDRLVVLKEPIGAAGDADARRRFLREARAAAHVTHPNVVAIHEVIEEPLAIVMEYASRGSLADAIREGGPLAPADAARVALDALAGLSAVHAAGIVHCDVKPSNVLFDASGRAKVADFGIARRASESTAMPGASVLGAGTPSYMAPEQREGGAVDARADVYAMGALLHEMLTGRNPRALASIDGPFADVARRARSPSPAERYGSASEMADAIRAELARLVPPRAP